MQQLTPEPPLPVQHNRAPLVLSLLARSAGLLGIAVGTIVFLGWSFDSPVLKGAIGVEITVKANTALCLLLTGVALLLTKGDSTRARRLAQLFGLFIAAIGGLTLSEHITGADLGIDQVLFDEPPGEAATSSPGRMGPPASASFVALGLGLLALDWRVGTRFPFRYLPLVVTLISLVSIAGYALQAPGLYATVRRTEIAWPTAVTLFVLSLGLLAARPANPLLGVIGSASAGGVAARRLLVPAIGVPFVLLVGYTGVRELGLIDASLGRGALAVLMVVVLTAFVLGTAHRLNQIAESQTRAERALRSREQELSDFFEESIVGTRWMDRDGVILRANQAELDLLGYESAEYVGRSSGDFFVDGRRFVDLLKPLQAGASVRDHPARMRCKDGSIIQVLIDGSPVFEDGRLVRARCFTRDVTQRRQAEIVQRRLSAIVDSSNDAIVSKELTGIVTSWNSAAERLFGYNALEMIGKPIATLIPADRSDEEVAILARLRSGERVEAFETVRRRKDGELVDVSLSISPIHDADGNVVGASKIARDITERKRNEAERESLLESERIARNEAERAARLRDEFLAVVSHELRTPLNSILGWAQVLKRGGALGKARTIEPKVLSDGMDAIERGARAQAQLIEDLLDMNRITTGKLPLEMKPTQLAPVIEAAIETLRPAIESKGIALRTELAGEMAPVSGDPTRLQQIVWNLVSNAAKFSPMGGHIDVALRKAGAFAEISVQDHGIGIDAEFLPHVFERFRQADASTTRAHGGLGLGLSIVKHLVELHRGTIEATSEGRGKGSTFIVKLPIKASAEGATHAIHGSRFVEPNAVDLGGIHVLVVEDDAESRDLAERILVQCNAKVSTAASAAQALSILEAETPDIMVSDIGMPLMDGYQLIRKVRESGRALPAIALTAYVRSEDRTRAMLAGYQMHIAKPMEPQELIATVASLVGRTARIE